MNWIRWCGLVLCAGMVQAATTNVDERADAELAAKIESFLASITYQTGTVTVGDGLATLNVPPNFRFVSAEDAGRILLFWGNPPREQNPLGMLFPANATPATEDSWAVVVDYEESGFVKDDDADEINYAKLLKEIQEGAQHESKARIKEGYEAIAVVGWAAPPRYDKATHKMYWAQEIKFGDAPETTLNYNLRILGRRGVLVLNAISSIKQLHEIESATPEILAMVDFQEGHRYQDFEPSSDKYAAYGLAALVAGGVAAKAGLFKGLIALLLVSKKFLIIGAIAVAALVKRRFSRAQAKREAK